MHLRSECIWLVELFLCVYLARGGGFVQGEEFGRQHPPLGRNNRQTTTARAGRSVHSCSLHTRDVVSSMSAGVQPWKGMCSAGPGHSADRDSGPVRFQCDWCMGWAQSAEGMDKVRVVDAQAKRPDDGALMCHNGVWWSEAGDHFQLCCLCYMVVSVCTYLIHI